MLDIDTDHGAKDIPALHNFFLLFFTGGLEPTQTWPLCVMSEGWKPPFLSQDQVSSQPGAARSIGPGSFLKAEEEGEADWTRV